MSGFEKILYILLAGGILVFWLPQAKRMFHESRKAATGADWKGFLMPIGAVTGFVFLLLWLNT